MLNIREANPHAFLAEINEIDQLAAVRIACVWGGYGSTPLQYDAAWELMKIQTVAPMCVYCKWAVFDDQEPHTDCANAMYCMYGTAAFSAQTYHSDESEENPSISEVYSRALQTFGGNTDLAREATSMYPGDFI